MDIIFLTLACILFFIYSSIATSRFFILIKIFNFNSLQIIIITILTHLGHLLGVMLYDIAKKTSIIKFFIGASVLFASLQIMLHYTNGDFAQIAILTLILYACYNLIDLCCGILVRYIPFMFSVLLRNFGSLLASAINLRINYTSSIVGKNLILYLACGSILCILYNNINIKMKFSNSIVSFSDLSILSREYSGIFWSFICINIIEILFSRYLMLFIHLISSKYVSILHLEITYYLGRLLLHYPIVIILSYFKSKWKILILLILNLILLLLMLFVHKYSILTLCCIFFIGGFSLLRHGMALFFGDQIQEELKYIPLDIALNKVRSICFFLAFVLEIIFFTGWSFTKYWTLLSYTIFIALNCISILCLLFVEYPKINDNI